MNKELQKFLDLLTDRNELTAEEIYSAYPELKPKAESILKEIHNTLREVETEKEMPWIKAARSRKEQFQKATSAVSEHIEEIRKLARDIIEGKINGDFLIQAQQFFRERGLKNMNEEELVEFLKDLKTIEKLTNEKKDQ